MSEQNRQEEAARNDRQRLEQQAVESRQLSERALAEERQRQEIRRMQDEQRRQDSQRQEEQRRQDEQRRQEERRRQEQRAQEERRKQERQQREDSQRQEQEPAREERLKEETRRKEENSQRKDDKTPQSQELRDLANTEDKYISNGLATLRSKKIHIALIVQSKSQLNAIYGKDVAEVIADNCSYKAILKASEPETQEWCSKLVGTYDKKKVSSNYNADILGVGKGQGTSSSTEEKRIIKPEEFAYLKDVVCVFPNGYKRLQKANYYEDKTFTDRM